MGNNHLIAKVHIYVFIKRKKNDNVRKWKKQDILSKEVIQWRECFFAFGLTNDVDHWNKTFQLWKKIDTNDKTLYIQCHYKDFEGYWKQRDDREHLREEKWYHLRILKDFLL